MTRGEQRIKQIEQFASKCYEDGEKYSAFISGAIWSDNNPDLSSLWHDATEEPEGVNWEILCQDKNDGCWVENRIEAQLLHKNWNAYTEIEKIVRWAYISDLLPKGGNL